MKIASFIATVGYVGYLPKAPGTWGTLVAVPLVLLPSKMIFIIGVVSFFVGWAATYCMLNAQKIPDKDPSYIVIDEFAAMAVFLSLPGLSVADWGDDMRQYWIQYVVLICVAFGIFRGFDILKPWPIISVDHYFKDKKNIWASFGVMIDDILAVIFALPFFYILVFGVGSYVDSVYHFKESLIPQ